MNYRIAPSGNKRNRFVIQKKVTYFFFFTVWKTLMNKLAHPLMPKEYLKDQAEREIQKLQSA